MCGDRLAQGREVDGGIGGEEAGTGGAEGVGVVCHAFGKKDYGDGGIEGLDDTLNPLEGALLVVGAWGGGSP